MPHRMNSIFIHVLYNRSFKCVWGLFIERRIANKKKLGCISTHKYAMYIPMLSICRKRAIVWIRLQLMAEQMYCQCEMRTSAVGNVSMGHYRNPEFCNWDRNSRRTVSRYNKIKLKATHTYVHTHFRSRFPGTFVCELLWLHTWLIH